MKARTMIILLTAAVMACCCTALAAETAGTRVTAGGEWSWDTGAYNTFDGEIDLAEYAGQELTVVMSSDLPYNDAVDADKHPVFTVVNGSRITMLRQSDTAQFTPETGNTVLAFSGSLKLPEKKHAQQITFTFRILDAGGKELKKETARLEGAEAAGNTAFYIAADINVIAACTGAAAVLVWAAAVIRNRLVKKKKK